MVVQYSTGENDRLADLSDLSRIARASAPHRRGGNHVKGQGRARRPNVENCFTGTRHKGVTFIAPLCVLTEDKNKLSIADIKIGKIYI